MMNTTQKVEGTIETKKRYGKITTEVENIKNKTKRNNQVCCVSKTYK